MVKNPSNLRILGVNLLIAVAIVVVSLVVVLLCLNRYTNHGKEVEVPQITGLYPKEAETLLSNSGLQMEIIDSTFTRKVPFGTIVEQNPPAESRVKISRPIYVVLNASAQRQIVLPELHDVSYRQATNTLRQLGLEVADVVYEDSEYRDLVLDIRDGDLSLETGDQLPEGTPLILVVGRGRGSDLMQVPDVMGLRLSQARSVLLSQHLTVGRVEYDEAPTENNKNTYLVYSQRPQAGSVAIAGSAIQIKLSADREKAVTANNVEEDEVFF